MQICTSLIFSLNMQAILGRLSSNWAFAIAMTDIADNLVDVAEHQHYLIDNNIDLGHILVLLLYLSKVSC